MKQPLGAAAGWLAVGIFLGRLCPLPLAFLFPVTCAVGGVALCASRRPKVWLVLFLLLTGWTNLAWRQPALSPIDLRHNVPASGELATLRGTLVSTPEQRLHFRDGLTRTNTLAVLDCVAKLAADKSWRPVSGLVLVSTPGLWTGEFHRTSEVDVSGILSPPPGPAAPGMFDYSEFLRWRDIHFELRAPTLADWQFSFPGRVSGPPWDERFQAWAMRTLALGLPETDTELMLLWTMILGWKTGLTDDVEEPFMRSGTMHVFAISGLHIALIAEILILLLQVLNLPRRVAGLAALPIVWLYTAATGWQPSAIRASVMSTVVVGGWVLARPSNVLNSLGTAALLILLWDPTQLFQAGFQLSFMAVAAIASLHHRLVAIGSRILARDPMLPAGAEPRWRKGLRALGMPLIQGASVSGAAWLGSAPMIACHFHLVSVSSLLANLIVVPLSTLALAGGVASLVCGPWLPSASVLFNHAGWFAMRCMIRVSQLAAATPGGCWNLATPPPALVILWYLMLAAWAGEWWRPCRLRPWVVTASLLLLAAFAGEAWWRRNDRRFVVLPLRGGHAVWVRTPEVTGLVDTGDERAAEAVVVPFLRASGQNRLPCLALTHGDVRHVGGAPFILQRFPTLEVVWPATRFRSGPYRKVVEALQNGSLGLVHPWAVAEGDSIGSPSARRHSEHRPSPPWRVLHPGKGANFARADDASLVLLDQGRDTSVLLAGDLGPLGQEVLSRRHPLLRAEVVIAGLTARGEAIAPDLLEHWGTKILVVADAMEPATARVSKTLKARLRRATGLRVLFASEIGAVDLRFHRGEWQVLDARGQPVPAETWWPTEKADSTADEARVVPGDEVKDRHADREAVGHLFQNDRTIPVGGVGIDLHPAVDRARVHDEHVRFEARHAGAVETELGAVLANARKHCLTLPLVLDAEQVHHVGIAQSLGHIPGDATAEFLEDLGDERGRTAQGDLGPEFAQRPDVRPRHAAEQDVPHDDDLEALEGAALLADGEDIEERLGGMLMRTVAGVDDAGLEKASEEMRGPGGAVPDNDDVGIHRLEVARRVPQRFPLLQRRSIRAEIDDVSGQPLGGEFEADPGARGRLDEQVDHRLAAQGGHSLDGPVSDGLETPGGVQNRDKFLGGQGLDIQQVAAVPGHGGLR
jgi:competence protein ComEC